jgi:multisubunit Na+/H+ antiporter MnhB subunit
VIDSPVLRTATRFAVPITVAISLVVFWQGHDLPGGGFIAGVMAASAGAMYLLAFGLDGAARVPWWRVSVGGLLISVVTGTVPLVRGFAFMDHGILDVEVPLVGHLHVPTATFFDLGVYLIVLGTLMTIFVELALEDR